METKVTDSSASVLQEEAISKQKARFEREMTEVLLNFREECLNMYRTKIDFGQPLDESGRFEINKPDLSAAEAICPNIKKCEIETVGLSVQQSVALDEITVEPISAATVAAPSYTYSYNAPSIECKKIETVEIAVPEIAFEGKEVEPASPLQMPRVSIEPTEVELARVKVNQIDIVDCNLNLSDVEYSVRPVVPTVGEISPCTFKNTEITMPEIKIASVSQEPIIVPDIKPYMNNEKKIVIDKAKQIVSADIMNVSFALPEVATDSFAVLPYSVAIPRVSDVRVDFKPESSETPELSITVPQVPTMNWD